MAFCLSSFVILERSASCFKMSLNTILIPVQQQYLMAAQLQYLQAYLSATSHQTQLHQQQLKAGTLIDGKNAVKELKLMGKPHHQGTKDDHEKSQEGNSEANDGEKRSGSPAVERRNLNAASPIFQFSNGF